MTDWDRMVESGASMAPEDIPPLVIYSGSQNNIETWKQETDARARHGSVVDRTLGAVFLSKHLAKRAEFFVGRGARERFRLTPDQLRKGLDKLEDRGLIETAREKRKGRYRRIRLR